MNTYWTAPNPLAFGQADFFYHEIAGLDLTISLDWKIFGRIGEKG